MTIEPYAIGLAALALLLLALSSVPPAVWRRARASLALAVAAWGCACTPAARATSATALDAAGAAAPLACEVPGLAGSSVCGPVAGVVSAVARMVADILRSLPPAAGARPAGDAAPLPPAAFRYRGCVVVLPAGVDVVAVRQRMLPAAE